MGDQEEYYRRTIERMDKGRSRSGPEGGTERETRPLARQDSRAMGWIFLGIPVALIAGMIYACNRIF